MRSRYNAIKIGHGFRFGFHQSLCDFEKISKTSLVEKYLPHRIILKSKRDEIYKMT